jgi:hypothetical protein
MEGREDCRWLRRPRLERPRPSHTCTGRGPVGALARAGADAKFEIGSIIEVAAGLPDCPAPLFDHITARRTSMYRKKIHLFEKRPEFGLTGFRADRSPLQGNNLLYSTWDHPHRSRLMEHGGGSGGWPLTASSLCASEFVSKLPSSQDSNFDMLKPDRAVRGSIKATAVGLAHVWQRRLFPWEFGTVCAGVSKTELWRLLKEMNFLSAHRSSSPMTPATQSVSPMCRTRQARPAWPVRSLRRHFRLDVMV